ncbi:DinB family protein [Williamsia sp.]|uniref:DinB family protein n=1 Tax=Williamsia sp. TaxID=1872085 RepID=UPI001A23282F|nr:DinB family protein [Williamsia sp.]MBJ7290937.1 DinB family protein [Williamsia sp.]
MAIDDRADLKDFLLVRLQFNRDAVLWKIDGVDEHDLRRPLTPSGLNLLGVVKHLAAVEFGYFGDTFGRPPEIPTPWLEGEWSDNADMWATADESVDDIVGLYRGAWAHAQKTFDASDLATPGLVPWWPADRRDVTLGKIIVHMLGETARHAGQMDILRESLDGAAGLYATNDNMAHSEASALRDYVAKLQEVADSVRGPR